MELISAIQDHDHERMRALLSADPAAASRPDDSGVSPVLHAAYVGNDEAIRMLLSVRPRLDFHEAAATGQTAQLGDMAAEDHRQSADGWTPLHLASFFGHVDSVETLLGRGADVHARSTNGLANHPLHAAAAGGHTEVCKLLIAHGADPNSTQAGGFTPLHAAADNGNRELVQLLLSAGARTDATTDAGETAAELAAKAGHADLAMELV